MSHVEDPSNNLKVNQQTLTGGVAENASNAKTEDATEPSTQQTSLIPNPADPAHDSAPDAFLAYLQAMKNLVELPVEVMNSKMTNQQKKKILEVLQGTFASNLEIMKEMEGMIEEAMKKMRDVEH